MNGLMYRKMVSCHFPAFIVLLGFFFIKDISKKIQYFTGIRWQFCG